MNPLPEITKLYDALAELQHATNGTTYPQDHRIWDAAKKAEEALAGRERVLGALGQESGSLQIGDFNLFRRGNKIAIHFEGGEGGDFSEKDVERAIRHYYQGAF